MKYLVFTLYTLTLTLTCSFLSTDKAWSTEGMDSGGGKAMVCFKTEELAKAVKENSGVIYDHQIAEISFLETIDLYFAKKLLGVDRLEPILVSEEPFANYWQLYLYLKERLKGVNPFLFQLIEQSEQTFQKSEIQWTNLAIEPIFDENLTQIVSNPKCLLTTMAVQFRDHGVDFLHIDERLFYHPLHSKFSQATLFLHEFLYLAARNNGSVHSRGVRNLMRYLVRKDLEKDKIDWMLLALGFR